MATKLRKKASEPVVQPLGLPPVYTVEELAAAGKKCPETIRCDLRAGRLQGVKVGWEWRVPHEAAIDWLNGK